MKKPNVFALRAELCKALKNAISEYGYDEEDELHFNNATLYNVINVCDESGEKDICFIEIKEDRVIFWMPCLNDMVDFEYFIDYRYIGNKTEFFMTCVGFMFRTIREVGCL